MKFLSSDLYSYIVLTEKQISHLSYITWLNRIILRQIKSLVYIGFGFCIREIDI